MAIATGTALALAAAAAAAGVNYYNTQRAAKKADTALAQGIREKSAAQRRADARIGDLLTETEASRSGDAAAQTLEGFQTALRGTEGQARAGQALQGLSSEYDAATQAAQGKATDYVQGLARTLSQIDAPGLQRQREGFGVGNLRTNLDVIGREAQGIDFLANLKAQGVRRNPYLDLLSAGLSAYAGGAGGATGAVAGGTTASQGFMGPPG